MSYRVTLVAGASTFALSIAAIAAQPACAQQAPPAPAQVATATNLEEIVVTARRREENLQSVPISVTAVTGAAIAAKGITNAIELSRQVPSVTIAGASTNPQLLTVGVRGVRQKEGHMFFDPSVVTIYAESVVAHPYGFGDTMYDVSNVQILKGPQGTLFGRNSPAGALIISPNYASLTEGFHGSASASVGDYNRQKYDLVVNIPLGDKAALRIAGEHFKRDGYVTNVINGDKWNGVGNNSVRASLTLAPTNWIKNYTTLDYLEEISSPYAIIPTQYLPGGSGVLVGGPATNIRLVNQQDALGPWKIASFAFTGILPKDPYNQAFCEPGSTRPFTQMCGRPFDKSYWLKSFGVVNRTDFDLGPVTLKNIASYRRFTRDTYQSSWRAAFADGTGGPGNDSITGSPSPIETFTEEVQLSGKSFENRLNWTTGVFYMNDHGFERNTSFQSIGATTSTTQNVAPTWLETHSLGVYGQGTYAVTDRLNFTAGIRYSHDEKKAQAGSLNYNVVTGAVTCSLFDANNRPLPATPQGCLLTGDKSWSAITFNVSVDYKLQPGTMVYGTISRGYRSGSFFPRAIRPSLFAYNPEFILNYETGLKSDWHLFDQPIRTNLSLFLSNQSDMQVQVQDVTTVPLSGYINNAGKARYWGGEFEATYKPIEPLTLTAFASYTDFKYLRYVDNTGVDLSYQTAPEPISPWQLGASAEYRVELGDDSALTFRGDLSWTSKVKTNNINPNAKGDWDQPAYTIMNIRADWSGIMGKPVDLGVWVTNLTNAWYSWGGTCLNGSCFAVPSPPRMWGVDVKYHF